MNRYQLTNINDWQCDNMKCTKPKQLEKSLLVQISTNIFDFYFADAGSFIFSDNASHTFS